MSNKCSSHKFPWYLLKGFFFYFIISTAAFPSSFLQICSNWNFFLNRKLKIFVFYYKFIFFFLFKVKKVGVKFETSIWTKITRLKYFRELNFLIDSILQHPIDFLEKILDADWYIYVIVLIFGELLYFLQERNSSKIYLELKTKILT